jgi:RHS repeat-associated protein
MIPKFDTNYNSLMSRHFDSLGVLSDVIPDFDFRIFKKNLDWNEPEYNYMYWYHKDHLGSSTQITDRNETVIHHIEYMPSGEQFSEQRDWWSTPYKFNGKELDQETGLYYYGARYYTPEIGIWLSVDPLSDKYPSLSPYAYCALNPVILVDPDGMEVEYNSITDRICVAILRATNSNFRNSFNTLKKSEETYVFNGAKNQKNELTTDGNKLFINYSFSSSSSQGTNWANNMKHETEHAMQFEHGEVGFELFDTGGPLGGDGVYYPNNEWKAVNFDLDDEIKARDKGYEGSVLNSNPNKNSKNSWKFGDNTIDEKKQALRDAGYKGEVPTNNPNHDKVKTSHQFMLPYRPRK